MGWTFFAKPAGSTPKQLMDKEYSYENDKKACKVLASAVVNWSEYYAAVEVTDKVSGTKFVYGAVALLKFVPKDQYNFGYKAMDETVGPYYYKMPAKLFALLTPLDDPSYPNASEGAKTWRAMVAATLTRPKVKKGDVVKFAAPVSFGSYGSFDNFVYEKGSIFVANGKRFRITNWKNKDYSIMGSL